MQVRSFVCIVLANQLALSLIINLVIDNYYRLRYHKRLVSLVSGHHI